MKANTFDAVVALYESITPIRGKRASQDLRPLGQRSRTWERIKKLDENTYALMDGYFNKQPELSPILWERKKDGDYITIRNNPSTSASISRYRFLWDYLPMGVGFTYGNSGKHYITYKGEVHYLPKFKVDTVEVSTNVWEYVIVDDYKIVFKCLPDGTFERANELQPYRTGRIDKKAFAEYATQVKELWDWMRVVMPVLGDTLYRDKWDYCKALDHAWSLGAVRKQLMIEILNNPEHEKRVALGVIAAFSSDAVSADGRFEEEKTSFSKFRNKIRKALDVYVREPR